MSPLAAARLSPAGRTNGADAEGFDELEVCKDESPEEELDGVLVALSGFSGSASASEWAASCNSASAASRPAVRSVHRSVTNCASPSSIHGWLERIQACVSEWASDGARVRSEERRVGKEWR